MQSWSLADAGRRPRVLVTWPAPTRALSFLIAAAITLLGLRPAAAQFVKSGDLVPGPAAQFALWGTIATPVSGVTRITDLKDFSVSQPSSNFARVWLAVGTQNGGNTAVSASNLIQWVYIRIDHKGVAEEPTNFNVQLNLGGAPAGRVDHLLTLRPIFSGPNAPSVGRVRIAMKRYSLDGSGNYPLLGAFTTSAFAATDGDNGGTTPDGTAIGWEAVATDSYNGFEVRIPASWFHGDASKLVEPDGTGANSTTTAFFTTGGSFGAVATVRDWLADAAGNNVVVNLSTTSGAGTSVTGTQLAFTTQPPAANAYATLGTIAVELRNADGTRVSGGTNGVTLEVASGPGGGTISGTTTVAAVDGTASFTDVRFSVPGTYTVIAKASGLLSATSNSFVISATTAAAPTITSITPGSGQLSVAYTAPANDGGATITTYQYSLDNGAWTTRSSGTTASPLVISGLTNGTSYSVRIRAMNAQGGGTASNAMSGTPVAPATPPSNTVAPTISGTTTVGQSLSASTGTWTGNPSPTFSYQWRRCDAGGSNCSDIAGATSSSYTLVSADEGSTVRVVVTGTNASGNASATSAQTAVVAAPPVNTVLPSISGTNSAGQLLTASAGTWTGTPTPTYAYQWRRCDTSGNACVDIAGATSTTYMLVSGDVGATIRVAVTGTNSAGNASATSAQTSTVTATPAAPSNTVVPSISGTAIVGQLLTSTTGTWSGYPTPSLSYQWQRCDAVGNACADISGATSSTYTLTSTDEGATIRVVVTGTNASGTVSATSTQTAVVANAPANTVAPSISGSTVSGQLLTASAGTWTGTPTPTLSYQWRRCDASGNSCVDIGGATATTYTATNADVAATIRVVVTGTNTAGNASATSAQTATVTATPTAPTNTVAPSITGTTNVGDLLTSSTGTWNGYPTPTLAYQWQRCNGSGSSCVDISGATSSTYTLSPTDEGATIRVVVTATNASGNANASSTQTAVVTTPPVNTIPPVISGTSEAGQVLSASAGTWTGTPTPTYGYQWRRCDTSGNSCIDIAGATSTTYTLVNADVGATIRIVVTGTNTAGNASATSTQTGTVLATSVAPANTVAPTTTGTLVNGQTLTATPGSWTGYPTPTLAYQWRRCDSSGSNCVDISGATASTYTLGNADIGSTIRVVVTATNTVGSANATASQTAVIAPAGTSPSSSSPPTISGTPLVGQQLLAVPGTWNGTPSPTNTYQWRRCNASGASCVDISGAQSTTYTLATGDVGSTIRVVVTATNTIGSASATSAQTGVVALPPESPAPTGTTTVSGTPQVGETLFANPGEWTGRPEPTLTYQWQRCDASGAACVDIVGANDARYTLGALDVNATIRVNVTGTNSAGTSESRSIVTGVIKPGKVSGTRSRVYAPRTDSLRPDSIPADGTRAGVVRVELRDAAGLPLAGRAADLTITIDGAATASVVRETAPGVYEFELRSTHINTAKVAITIDGVTLDEHPAVTFVQAVADLDVKLSATNEAPQVGQTVVFTIEVKNLGPNNATSVEVEHVIADRLKYVSSEATRGQFDAEKGIWAVGSLALGETVVLKVTVVVVK